MPSKWECENLRIIGKIQNWLIGNQLQCNQ